jgi:hypothetical protein
LFEQVRGEREQLPKVLCTLRSNSV